MPPGPYNGPLAVISALMPPTVALLFPLMVGLAVLRYRLFDVDRVLRLTVTWLLLAIVLLAGFVALAFVASRSAVAIAGPEAAADPASSVMAALLVAAVAYPVHQRLVHALDRLVFRARAARADLLEEAAEVLGRAQPPEVVGVFLTQRTPRRLGLQTAWVAVTPAIGALADEEVHGPRTQFTRVSPDVAQRLGSLAAPLVLTTAADREAYSGVNVAAADDPALATLYASGARVLVPLRADAGEQNRLVGVWALGSRSDVGPLEREDLQALDRVGKLAALLLVVQAEGRERERIQQELGVARVIQHTLLPPAPPCLPGWRIRAHYQAARQVGGDFYDFVALPGGRLGVAIGDVSGKGIPAALVMATTQSILRATAASGVPPCEVLERTNAFLRQRLSERMFVTCQYAVLDTQTGCLRYANAGHCPAYQRTSDRTVELSATGLPLGVSADAHYADEIIQLAPGDCLVMYSDGVVEARAPSGEMFGFNRLAELVAAGDRGRLVERILGNLERFRGSDAPPEDDVTLVILEHT